MKKAISLSIVLSLFLLPLWAQQPDLPKYMTEGEKMMWDDYLESVKSSRQTASLPEVPVRVMGEWEEIQALFLTWRSYPAILTEIVKYAVEEVTVYIITDNEASVANTLSNAGISLERVEFIDWPSNSVWIRDYGPWAVYENDVEQLAISDYIYNRPRPLDNQIPEWVAEEFELPYYAATQAPYDWVHAGGNNLVDGYKTGFSSKITLVENPDKTEDELDYIGKRLFGYDRYIKMEELPYDVISHLDMHMRFIDEETVIVGEYPDGVADGPQINANIEYLLNNHTSSFGNPFEVIRIPMPPAANGNYPDEGGHYRTFTNSIFLNGTILVPIYEEQYDTVGLRIYRESLPGYNVVGIDCNDMIGSLGALHCITKTVGVDDPLWIAHPRQRDLYSENASPVIRAKVKHRSGIESVELFYRGSSEEDYQSIVMDPSEYGEDWYEANLPPFSFGTQVDYYIRAEAQSGKTQLRPIVAPEGYFKYEVRSPESAPATSFSSNVTEICPGGRVKFLDRTESGVVEREWIFYGGEPATSDQPNPEVTYGESGIYDVVLITTNNLGSDTLRIEDYIQIEPGLQPFVESFEDGLDVNLWENVDSGSGTLLWEDFEGSNCYNQKAIRLDNFTSDHRGRTSTLSAVFDLSEMEEPTLYFSLAYAPYDQDFADRLQVELTNCTGDSRIVFDERRFELSTAPATGNSEFIPANCSEWRDLTIDISDFSGDIVTLAFNNISGWGNMLYLDNIFIKDAALENMQPIAYFIHPERDTTFQTDFPVSLELEMNGEDSDGFVRELVLEMENVAVAQFDRQPYTYTLDITEPGVYEIKTRAIDNEGLEGLPTQLVITAEDIGSSVSDRELPDWNLFPNPTTGELRLQHSLHPHCDTGDFWIVDKLGKTVFGPLDGSRAEGGISLDQLPAGDYHFFWEACGQKLTKPFLIIR